jgi:hypothetical protein
MIFLGSERTTLKHQPLEVSNIMLFPQYLIVAVMLSIAFYPRFYLDVVGNLLNNFVTESAMTGSINWSGYSGSLANINLYSLLFIGVIVVIWVARSRFVASKKQEIGPTWGCGLLAQRASSSPAFLTHLLL